MTRPRFASIFGYIVLKFILALSATTDMASPSLIGSSSWQRYASYVWRA